MLKADTCLWTWLLQLHACLNDVLQDLDAGKLLPLREGVRNASTGMHLSTGACAGA